MIVTYRVDNPAALARAKRLQAKADHKSTRRGQATPGGGR
jgi:hypothetical protein